MLLYMLGVTLSLLYAYKKMRKLSNEDQTTGLKNRNAYECYMADIQNRIFACLTCVFMDVNGLHEINNKHGHKVGDQMLKTVANELLLEFPYRQVFRIGGDEFVVISDEYDADACTEKMERIARQVASYNYSISYGIAHDKNVIGADIIVQEADERMLESKRAYYAENNRYR
jgi:diguanylate cyclase (GGDEF)-like protein